ncbi:carbohydrate-binding module family 18 protein [Piromyces sp. E2]|nr:carbohydrate-binding module family 18 protein [Piromyces sp. E2]|eukprot:OUM70340.1 carbohydrate-binding module family 18 protein [Piromyces sp. E2]
MNFKLLSVLVAVLLASQNANASLTQNQRNALLKLHRNARSAVGASNMKNINWSSDLEASAQNYANKCKGMVHSGPRENLAGASGNKTPEYLFNLWMDEKKDFDKYGNYKKFTSCEANGKDIGHYTQIVWAENTAVGCGFAQCPKSKYKSYLVCQYGKGNIVNRPVYQKSGNNNNSNKNNNNNKSNNLPISDDRCGAGVARCKSGLCCSKYGWCGTSKDHCGTGCQKAFGKCN